jgi:group I intron endonuclease
MTPLKKISGVYQIKNLVNGKIYVGSAVNIKERWATHKKLLRHQKHHSRYLQRAWNKYGEDSFSFEILEECPVEKLIQSEQVWMDLFRSYVELFGYNISPTAGNSFGTKHSEKTKEKKRGENNPQAKLTWFQVREIREKYLTGKYTQLNLAKEYKICQVSITSILYNKQWKDETLTEEYFQKIRQLKRTRKCGVGFRANFKLTWDRVREIRKKYLSGDYTYSQLSSEYGVNNSNIERIINNKNWKEN